MWAMIPFVFEVRSCVSEQGKRNPQPANENVHECAPTVIVKAVIHEFPDNDKITEKVVGGSV